MTCRDFLCRLTMCRAILSQLRLTYIFQFLGLRSDSLHHFFDTPARTRACEDCLLRRFSQALSHTRYTTSGSGKSGLLSTSTPGAVVLKCSPCEVSDTGCILRFVAGLLAHGRRIDARAAEHMLCDVLPACIDEALVAFDELQEEIQATCDLADDQQFICDELMRLHLVAFVADGSVLPRASGVSLRPLAHARPFTSPAHLKGFAQNSSSRRNHGNGSSSGRHPYRWWRLSRKINVAPGIARGSLRSYCR